MTEDELNAMLAVHVGNDYGTHWDTCHHDGNPRQHAGCAVSKLVAEVRRLRADLKYYVDGNVGLRADEILNDNGDHDDAD